MTLPKLKPFIQSLGSLSDQIAEKRMKWKICKMNKIKKSLMGSLSFQVAYDYSFPKLYDFMK